MGKTEHHKMGDKFIFRKNHAGSKRIPRKEWREGKLMNRMARKQFGLEIILSEC